MPPPPRFALVLAALALPSLALLPACQALRWDPLGHIVQVKAQYHRMEGRSAAVVVAIPSQVLDPDAGHDIGRAITRRMAANIKGIKMVPYSRVQAFVDANPYWMIKPPSAVQKALGVDRLVWVDVQDFRTHEEGASSDLLQGLASGSIQVLEAETGENNTYAFSQSVTTQYPTMQHSSVGLPDGQNDLTEGKVRFNLIQLFSRDTAGAFYDHEETR